jgi:hypothetical protein
MAEENNELDHLSKEIRKVISDNNRFLEKVMDDEFEPDEEDAGTDDDEAGTLVEL